MAKAAFELFSIPLAKANGNEFCGHSLKGLVVEAAGYLLLKKLRIISANFGVFIAVLFAVDLILVFHCRRF